MPRPVSTNLILRDGVVGTGESHRRPFFAQENSGHDFLAVAVSHALPPLPHVVAEALSYVTHAQDVHVREWTFMSPDTVRERHNALGFTAFAFRYAGMGHVECLGYCPTCDVTFQFSDGGSNDYDRKENHERAKTMSIADKRAHLVDLEQHIWLHEVYG
jgi:hypothetical protein